MRRITAEIHNTASHAGDSPLGVLDILDENDTLNNPLTCMHPVMHHEKKCHECGFAPRCIFEGKGDYRKRKQRASIGV